MTFPSLTLFQRTTASFDMAHVGSAQTVAMGLKPHEAEMAQAISFREGAENLNLVAPDRDQSRYRHANVYMNNGDVQPWFDSAESVFGLVALARRFTDDDGSGEHNTLLSSRASLGAIQQFMRGEENNLYWDWDQAGITMQDWLLTQGIDVTVINDKMRENIARFEAIPPQTKISFETYDHKGGKTTIQGSFLGIFENPPNHQGICALMRVDGIIRIIPVRDLAWQSQPKVEN